MKLSLKSKALLVLLLLGLSMMVPMAFADDDLDGEEDGEDNGKHLGLYKNRERKEKHTQSAYNGLNKGKKVIHLYLYEKDPTTWEIVENGSWAKLTILTHKDKYIFNAHELEPDDNYTLINYAPETNWTAVYNGDIPDPWPGIGSTEFTSGTVNEEGNLHLKGELDMEIDGKVWLVLSDDYDGNQMIGWQPTEYLFEYDLLYVK